MSDSKPESVEWIPEEFDSIGSCIVCGGDVYPANPDELNENQRKSWMPIGMDDPPVAHEGCGW